MSTQFEQVAPFSSERFSAPNNWPLLAFLFFLPLQNVQIVLFPPIYSGLNFLNLGFMLVFLGAFFAKGRWGDGHGVGLWVLIYISYSVVSFLVGKNTLNYGTDDHFSYLKDQTIPILLFFVIQRSIGDWRNLRAIVFALLLPLPYFLRVVWSQAQSVSTWHYSDDQRISGPFLFLGANEMAAWALYVFLLSFALLVTVPKSLFWRSYFLFGAIASGISLVYSYSRTAYIAAPVAFLAIVLRHKKRGRILVFALIASISLTPFLPVSVVERFDTIVVDQGKQDKSTQSRLVFWNIAFEKWQGAPVLGIGYHTFHHEQINPFGKDTHNYFIKEFVERGAVGVIVFLVVLWKIFKSSTMQLARGIGDPWGRAICTAAAGVVVAMIILNTFGDRFSHYPLAYFFWTMAGLVMAVRRLSGLEHPSNP